MKTCLGILALLAGLGAGLGAAPTSAVADEESLTGRAYVADGGTIRIEGHAFRLWGIAVPDYEKPAGRSATIALFRIIEGKMATCHRAGLVEDRVHWGKCEAQGLDIGAMLVDAGFARDCPAQSGGRYRAQEQRAKEKGSTILADFTLPDRCGRGQGRKAATKARKSPAG